MLRYRKIKIVYVIGQLTVGGTEQQLLVLLKKLNPQRFEPCVICLSEKQPSLKIKYQQLKIPVYVIAREQNNRLTILWNLYCLLRKISPDIVHTFSFASRAAILASKVVGHSKIIVSFRTDPKRWVSYFDLLLINSTNLILDNSVAAISSYKSINRSLKNPLVEVVHNGIDLSLFDEAMHEEIAQPTPFLLQPNLPVICVVAGLRPAKNLSLLLEAYALLRCSFPNVRLWFVGEGEEREKLERITFNLGLASYVCFCGIQTNIPAILKKSFMGVLSSKIEGLPNSILEYMSAGLPVVATNVGGNSEIVLHGKTGLLVPFDEPQAFADAMQYYLKNPEIARQCGEAGRSRIEENFTIERMVHETESVYKKLMRSGEY
jgi:glycosyltransferase involved in cell wall biosynthesis